MTEARSSIRIPQAKSPPTSLRLSRGVRKVPPQVDPESPQRDRVDLSNGAVSVLSEPSPKHRSEKGKKKRRTLFRSLFQCVLCLSQRPYGRACDVAFGTCFFYPLFYQLTPARPDQTLQHHEAASGEGLAVCEMKILRLLGSVVSWWALLGARRRTLVKTSGPRLQLETRPELAVSFSKAFRLTLKSSWKWTACPRKDPEISIPDRWCHPLE